MSTNIRERLKRFLSEEGVSQKDFAKSIGVSSGYVNAIRSSIQPDKIAKIRALYPNLDIAWLMTGEGNIYSNAIISNSGDGETNPSSDPPHEGTKQVHYFPDIEATGGNKQLFEDYSERAISLAIPRNFDADFALPLAGDSMTPLYQPGSIILVKRWQERFIEYGKVYLIITTQGNRMVKYLRAAERNEEVLCVSENSAYDPFTIPREDILALYMVKGCIFHHRL